MNAYEVLYENLEDISRNSDLPFEVPETPQDISRNSDLPFEVPETPLNRLKAPESNLLDFLGKGGLCGGLACKWGEAVMFNRIEEWNRCMALLTTQYPANQKLSEKIAALLSGPILLGEQEAGFMLPKYDERKRLMELVQFIGSLTIYHKWQYFVKSNSEGFEDVTRIACRNEYKRDKYNNDKGWRTLGFNVVMGFVSVKNTLNLNETGFLMQLLALYIDANNSFHTCLQISVCPTTNKPGHRIACCRRQWMGGYYVFDANYLSARQPTIQPTIQIGNEYPQDWLCGTRYVPTEEMLVFEIHQAFKRVGFNLAMEGYIIRSEIFTDARKSPLASNDMFGNKGRRHTIDSLGAFPSAYIRRIYDQVKKENDYSDLSFLGLFDSTGYEKNGKSNPERFLAPCFLKQIK